MGLIDFTHVSNIIDGSTRPTQAVRYGINPATEESLWPAPVSSSDDVDAAVDAAKRAAPVWAATSWTDRQKCVAQFADALESHADQFAKMLVLEQGKLVGDAGSNATPSGHGLANLTTSSSLRPSSSLPTLYGCCEAFPRCIFPIESSRKLDVAESLNVASPLVLAASH